ncbi:O-linked N-acetylglucosamine transferase, SPINDLY family protein [Falsiruegeria litorea]|nr:tetratricopeptide repeat protein [Falsiruegeria litorea]
MAQPVAKLRKLHSLLNKGQNREVLQRGTRLLKAHPGNRDLLLMLARANRRSGRAKAAVSCLTQVLGQDRHQPLAWVEMGDARKQLGQNALALAAYETAVDLDAGCFAAWHNLGTLRLALGDAVGAVKALERAVQLAPDQGLARLNLANAYRAAGDLAQAEHHVAKAFTTGHKTPEVPYLHAAILRGCGQHASAIQALKQVLACDPRHVMAQADLAFLLAQNADWSETAQALRDRVNAGEISGEVAPFVCLSMQDDGAAQLLRSAAHAARNWPAVADPVPARARDVAGVLQVGYFTSDAHAHATLDLMAGLFAAHDQARVKVHVYAYDTTPGDEARARVQSAVPVYRDVAALSDQEIAALAREDGLDLAIDLKGHTEHARLGIFAHRAAPVQATWLGYPGSTGAPFIDYVIGDHIAIPPTAEAQFSEQVIRLPGSYQVNNDQRPVAEIRHDRAALGLPEEGFVFCCFNATYKICPRVFVIWMELLHQVDGSVLWLLDPGEMARDNLRRAAQGQGIDPLRLVFAPRWPSAEHLARHRQADLFLDTFAVNAHTTASDALWAGVPVVTRPGEQFAARVGASLVSACGLPELIAETDEGYLSLALRMVRDAAFHKGVRARLGQQNGALPLFDTNAFARKLEDAFEQMTRGPK